MRSHDFGFSDHKDFAFSILDDTDDSTVENVRPIYEMLDELGLRTTKTVWMLDCPEGSRLYFAGQTLHDSGYRALCHKLVDKGFELAWHCATMESSDRTRTLQALDSFYREFGFYPKIHCNHGQNQENIYWGPKRYQNPVMRTLSRLVANSETTTFSGEQEASAYFWGDLCRKHFQFVRNFTFRELNVLEVNPDIPYRLTQTPYVNYWFSTTDVPDVHAFNQLVTRETLDQLHKERGVCILSTHFGKGFVKDGKINKQVAETFRYLASLPGWFVPVSDILAYLLAHRPSGELSWHSQLKLELRHAYDRIWMSR